MRGGGGGRGNTSRLPRSLHFPLEATATARLACCRHVVSSSGPGLLLQPPPRSRGPCALVRPAGFLPLAEGDGGGGLARDWSLAGAVDLAPYWSLWPGDDEGI